MIRALPIALLLLTAACGKEEEAVPPTAAENAQLDEADQMLDDLAKDHPPVPEPDTNSAN